MKDRVEFGKMGISGKPGWEWFKFNGLYYCYDCANDIRMAALPVTDKSWLKNYQEIPDPYYCESCHRQWNGGGYVDTLPSV